MATGKIIIYEHKNFGGASHEVTADVSNLSALGMNDKISSIKVYGSVWIGYEHVDYGGRQYILEEGAYPNWDVWQGVDDQLSSLKRLYAGEPPSIVLYEHGNYGGASVTFNHKIFHLGNHNFNDKVSSLKVKQGTWVLYEDPTFKGRQCIVTEGDYPNWESWKGVNDTMSSLRPVHKPL